MSKIKTSAKKRVAVFFGGRSPEHDVSIVTGLQILQALDPQRYDAFPVYITPDGRWAIGDVLRQRESYLLDKTCEKQVQWVSLDVNVQDGTSARGVLKNTEKKMFQADIAQTFDVALPAFHGLYGEDGNVQGLFEFAGIPYCGMRTMASTILMDKVATKNFLKALEIPHLPCAVLKRPAEGYFISEEDIAASMGDLSFPCILKPSHLGSSIGVAKVESCDEVQACLPAVFEYDDVTILEPFVEHMAEYNVAVACIDGEVETSAIERPKSTEELLDFKQKYMLGGDNKAGTKDPGQVSEGMLSLTRELNPDLKPGVEAKLRGWAKTMFEEIEGTGAPRIDYICNTKTGEFWMNEVNPFPGSIGYFLWEAADNSLLFSELLTSLVEEALDQRKKRALPKDPVPADARLHKRPL